MTYSQDWLNQLNLSGVIIMPGFEKNEISEINEHLQSKPVFFDAHVPQTARNRGDGDVDRSDSRVLGSECLCVHNDHVLTAPHMLERALSYTDFVAAYLGRDPPVMYSCNAFWTRPGTAAIRDDIQAYHQDRDDPKFLAMFVYLTDVLTVEDGPHDITGPDGAVRTIYGKAGSVFFADTSRLHRGRKPQTHERGLVWFRWGITDRPVAVEWDQIRPIERSQLGNRYPQDPRLQESVRLLV